MVKLMMQNLLPKYAAASKRITGQTTTTRHGRPASVQRDCASSDSHNVVATGLHNIMNGYRIHRPSKAEHCSDDGFGIPLFLCWHQGRTFGVENSCKNSHDACQRTRNAKGRRKQKFNFDIAENDSSRPVVDIVRGPNDGIGEIAQVHDDGPDDQIASCDIAVFDVPDQRRYVKCKCNEC